MHLILTGATGLVGAGVLDAMLKSQEVTKISVLSRRPVAMAEHAKDPRVNVIIHQDFGHYGQDVLGALRGANGAVWALGVSQTQVSGDDYVKITKDYALAAAEAFSELAPGSEPFRFIFVSGEGATQNPGLFSATFARVKGETESLLSGLREKHPRLKTETIRPAVVDPGEHDAVKPFIPHLGLGRRALLNLLSGPLHPLARPMHSPTEPLGKFMVDMTMGKYESQLNAGMPGILTLQGGMRIVENSAFRKLAGLS